MNGGQLRHAHAAVVAEDGPDRLNLYIPVGTEAHWSAVDHDTGEIDDPRPAPWHTNNVLQMLEPGPWSSVWCMWRAASWDFACWYVNFQTPIRRTAIGVDTGDLSLDIVVRPDLSWEWKDEDHFALLQGHGLITPQEAAEVRREAGRMVARIEARDWPFCEDWSGWRPDPAWAVPSLPATWRTIPT